MKTVLYTFSSGFGTFWIQPQPAGRVLLGIDNHQLRTYSSARLAANSVYEQKTGWAQWDEAEGVSRPPTLKQWRRPRVSTARKRAKRGNATTAELRDENGT
jgi:hypothetical protein